MRHAFPRRVSRSSSEREGGREWEAPDEITMLHRRLNQKRPKRLPGDTPLLRDRFMQDFDFPPGSIHRYPRWSEGVFDTYYEWLREKGIDPETGRMTLEGLAFFKQLLEDDRRKKLERDRRPEP